MKKQSKSYNSLDYGILIELLKSKIFFFQIKQTQKINFGFTFSIHFRAEFPESAGSTCSGIDSSTTLEQSSCFKDDPVLVSGYELRLEVGFDSRYAPPVAASAALKINYIKENQYNANLSLNPI